MAACPICNIGECAGESIDDGVRSITCSNCGRYRVSVDTLSDFEAAASRGRYRREALAFEIRRRARSDESILVTAELVEQATRDAIELPDPVEQVDNLVRWIAENRAPGEKADVRYNSFQAIIGTATKAGFAWVTQVAKDRRLIDGARTDHQMLAILTFEGWKWYADVGRHQRSRQAFMAMAFGDAELDAIVEKYFRPAVQLTGFTLQRLDDAPEAGPIDNRLRVEIRRSRLLICDLSHDNRGAYFEAGFAEGLGLPVIYTCDEEKFGDVHFDTRQSLFVVWQRNDLPSAAEQLKATIRNTLPADAILEDPDES